MNIVNTLTVRQLKKNKKRTLVTIIGVIISVAMVTAVSTLGISFLDLMIRQTIASDGEWHVLYKDVNEAQLKAVANDEATEKVAISKDRGYALFDAGQSESKPYLFIKQYDAAGFEQFPIELIKGRLPQDSNEIVVPQVVSDKARAEFEIGAQVTLNIGQRVLIEDHNQALSPHQQLQRGNDQIKETIIGNSTATYTIVGHINIPTWERAWAPWHAVVGYVDQNTFTDDTTVDAMVVLKEVKSSLFSHAKNVASSNNIAELHFNNELLRYYGVTDNDQLRSTLFSLSAIIMTIIVIGSVSLIYNAFAISVSERSRHLGMLASVGATKRQKRNSVFFEGAIIGLISVPIGIVCGLVGIGVTFWFINSTIQGALGITETLTLSVTPLSIMMTCAISIITIFISTYLPARKASRISAIDAIRQTNDVKLTGKTVKTSKLVRWLFGIEAEIALKNLKRNKRRYQATIFSLVISIVLFLAVSFFTANLVKSIRLTQGGINYDISVAVDDKVMSRELADAIATLDDVKEYSLRSDLRVLSWVSQDMLSSELQERVADNKNMLRNDKYPYAVVIHALDEQSLRRYAQEVGVGVERLLDPDSLAGIVIDTINYQDRAEVKYVQTKAIDIQVGQNIDLSYNDRNTEEGTYFNGLEVAALTKELPMGVHPAGIGSLNIVISDQVLDVLQGDAQIDNFSTYITLKSSNPIRTQQQIQNIVGSNTYIYNVYQVRQREEQMVLLMSVFTYGFIVLITAISIANILNTISTSIALRKKEFAMLKSVGMTPKGFQRMINYESIFYGLQSLLFGLPISIGVMYLIHRSLMNVFRFAFTLPWLSIGYVVTAVFIIVGSAMLYSSAKVKKENIIDALRQENI